MHVMAIAQHAVPRATLHGILFRYSFELCAHLITDRLPNKVRPNWEREPCAVREHRSRASG